MVNYSKPHTSICHTKHKQAGAGCLVSRPRNPYHKTYRSNEKSINQALCKHISKRSIDIRARDIYSDAGVTSPTFYYHYHNANDALKSYEDTLARELTRITPSVSSKHSFYTILTRFVGHNYIYFVAVAEGDDHHLLKEILHSYRTILVDHTITEYNFRAYTGVIISIINYWMLQDHHDPTKTTLYAERLSNVRPIRWW